MASLEKVSTQINLNDSLPSRVLPSIESALERMEDAAIVQSQLAASLDSIQQEKAVEGKEAEGQQALLRGRWGHRLPGQIGVRDATLKMKKNSDKAFAEACQSYLIRQNNPHEQEHKPDGSVYHSQEIFAQDESSMEMLLERIGQPDEEDRGFGVDLYLLSDRGTREVNEDGCFQVIHDKRRSALMGLFDGHHGYEVAQYASAQFQEKFFRILDRQKGNVHATLELVFDEIQKEIMGRYPQWRSGSTAVVNYFDLKRGLLYTATLSNSEAFLYRDAQACQEELPKVIPLSNVRDWHSKRDQERVKQVIEEDTKIKKSQKDPSRMVLTKNWGQQSGRYTLLYRTTHVNGRTKGKEHWEGGLYKSRALGNQSFEGAIVPKTKIGISLLQRGDFFFSCTDGITDYQGPATRARIIQKSIQQGPQAVATALMDDAMERVEKLREAARECKMDESGYGDNATIIALQVR